MNEESGKVYDLEDRLLEYGTRILKLVEALPNTKSGQHTAGQILRSGTSPLSQHGEAQAAESPKDFRHKLKIGLKELKETWRWLRLIKHAELLKPAIKLDSTLQETDESIRIFASSIKTSRARSNRRQPPAK